MARPTGQGGIDYPDGGFTSGVWSYPILGDVGELAVRMGSPVIFDRRGTVYFIDTFERETVVWEEVEVGGGREVRLSAVRALSGSFSLAMVPASSTPYSHVVKRGIPLPPTTRVGLSVGFSLSQWHDYVQISADFFGPVTAVRGGVRYYPPGGPLQIRTGESEWTTISDNVFLFPASYIFHYVKFVIDTVTRQYVRVILNDYSFENLTYPTYVMTSPYPSHLQLVLWIYAKDSSQPVAYFDNVIVTVNEP